MKDAQSPGKNPGDLFLRSVCKNTPFESALKYILTNGGGMSKTEPVLLRELKDGVLKLSLNRPKVNAIHTDLLQALKAAFHQAEGDIQVRCVLLAARGSTFSAGQDVNEIKQAQGTSYRGHLQHTYNPLILQIRRLGKPVLAAINGSVSGAALGIVLACDLRIAAETARFVVRFSGIGLAPDSAVSLLLPAMIGLGRAFEYACTNAPLDAQQALSFGLVNRVVPAAELENHADLWAAALAHGPVNTLGLIKRAFNKAILANLEQVLDYEAYLQDIASQGSEHREGLQAFLEKRPPNFYDLK
jgi:2-(1,2-epoxy-1,2-dihydrophenyl)acetyl-CoA isomerase